MCGRIPEEGRLQGGLLRDCRAEYFMLSVLRSIKLLCTSGETQTYVLCTNLCTKNDMSVNAMVIKKTHPHPGYRILKKKIYASFQLD